MNKNQNFELGELHAKTEHKVFDGDWEQMMCLRIDGLNYIQIAELSVILGIILRKEVGKRFCAEVLWPKNESTTKEKELDETFEAPTGLRIYDELVVKKRLIGIEKNLDFFSEKRSKKTKNKKGGK